MNKKVSLKEIVGTKIIFAVLLVTYYWMWARTDWKDYYLTIQSVLFCVTIVFFCVQYFRIKRYKKESVDEMAEYNLKRCDSICLKIFIAVMAVVAWACGILSHINAISTSIVGWIIMISIVVLSVVRTVLFVIMDSKGV